MRTGNRDKTTTADEPVQRLRTVDDRHPPLLGQDVLGILGPDRAGVNDGVRVAEIGGIVPDMHPRPEQCELTQRIAIGSVGTRDPRTACRVRSWHRIDPSLGVERRVND